MRALQVQTLALVTLVAVVSGRDGRALGFLSSGGSSASPTKVRGDRTRGVGLLGRGAVTPGSRRAWRAIRPRWYMV